ncbi:MAG: excinuclease ABC subunit UvrA [Bacteroidia bacterium]|nr:excinuclease ABC subunit UvrA [Bacteroidia bacterium]
MAKNTQKVIEIKGAKMHNLKNLDVQIKRNQFTVVTGVSGSGKSSLVFDTLYAEGQRRYVESLSSYARQFLGKLDKPEVDYIKGLTPCVAIEQKVNTRNPRSTVATSTEIYDYLKLLFTRIGKTYSPISGEEVKCHSVQDVVDYLIQNAKEDNHIYIVTELAFEKAETLQQVLDLEAQKGYSRLLYKDKVVKISDFKEERVRSKDVYLLIDRIVAESKPDDEYMQRLNDSVQTAFYEGKGILTIQIRNDEETTSKEFSNLFELDGMQFERPTINFLSFNNPYGACKTCQGFGTIIGIDEDLVVPDKGKSLFEGAVAPWRGETLSVWKRDFIAMAEENNFPIHKPYIDLSEAEKDLLWQGNESTKGINDFVDFLKENSYKIQYRVMMAKYRGKTTCPDCKGTRLRKDTNYVKLVSTQKMPFHSKGTPDKIALAEVLLLTVDEAIRLFDQIKLSEHDGQIADRLFTEIDSRLKFLSDVGLGYLGLNRLSNSLSGGESQRINLATSLGSSLVGSTYILDEPSIGLHSRDTERLIKVLKNLQRAGNTVVVVEHDEELMNAADELIDIGPFAGTNGGEVVFNGTFTDLMASKTLTADFLNNVRQIEIPEHRRKWNNFIEVKNARYNNLKNVSTKIPLSAFTVVTGVSGSGKTSLVKGVFHPAIMRALDQYAGVRPGESDGLGGDVSQVDAVEMIDQNPIGKSSRSNPVTYVKAFDAIRDLFTEQVLAKQRGYKSSIFSFNVDGGRCDNCKGEGEEIIEMQFMADLHLPCEVCKGKRFKQEVLEVTYNGKSIYDVLSMTVDEAIDFFENVSLIRKRLQPLQDVGLGYVSLGQSSNTLSGGEAQRIKLASFLGKNTSSTHTLFIFDEPTTGLHFHDIQKLLKSFKALVDQGNTVITIEHNLDVIKTADWVIDLGPEGGKNGGNIVFEGTPDDLVDCKESYTGQYLKKKLAGDFLNPALRSN